MLVRLFPRACGGLTLVGLLVVAAGCGPDYKARGVVKGKVTIGKKHLTTGTVMFHGKHNMTGSATIDKNGNYVMNDAPLGEVQVTVSVPQGPAGGVSRMKAPWAFDKKKKDKKKDKNWGKSVDPEDPTRSISIMGDIPPEIVPIPDRYSKVETSGLTFTVKSGEQTYDIPLTPVKK